MAGVWIATIRLFLRDAWVRVFLSLTIIIIGMIALAIGLFAPQGDNLPLHYNVYFSIDLVGSGVLMWWFFGVAVLLCVFNMIIALLVWRRDRVISYFMGAGTVLVMAILATATILVIIVSRS